MSSDPTANILTILVAQEINDALRNSPVDSHDFVLGVSAFLVQVNLRIKAYKNLFGLPVINTTEEMDEPLLKKIVQESDLGSFISFGNETMTVEVVPHKFQSLITGVLVDSSIRYTKVLVRQVEGLSQKYHDLMLGTVPAVESIKEGEDDVMFDAHSNTEDAKEQVQVATSDVSETMQKLFEEPDLLKTPSIVDVDDASEVPGAAILKNESEFESSKSLPEVQVPEVQESASQVQTEATEARKTVETDGSTTEKSEEGEKPEEVKEKIEFAENTTPERTDVEKKEEIPAVINSKAALSDKEQRATPEGEENATHNVIEQELSRKRSRSPLVLAHKHKRFQNIAINLVKSIEEHRFSSPFLTPVAADDYNDVVYEPKDLKSILRAVKQKEEPAPYGTVKELEREIILMFANCVMYNKSSTPLVKMAAEMKNEVRNTFKMFEEAESEIS